MAWYEPSPQPPAWIFSTLPVPVTFITWMPAVSQLEQQSYGQPPGKPWFEPRQPDDPWRITPLTETVRRIMATQPLTQSYRQPRGKPWFQPTPVLPAWTFKAVPVPPFQVAWGPPLYQLSQSYRSRTHLRFFLPRPPDREWIGMFFHDKILRSLAVLSSPGSTRADISSEQQILAALSSPQATRTTVD
jgi:hypothetical protein